MVGRAPGLLLGSMLVLGYGGSPTTDPGEVEALDARAIRSAAATGAGGALLAGGRVKVGASARVEGHVHSNERVELRRESVVAGDVSAVREVKGRGEVLGSVTEHAEAVALAPLPDRREVPAGADRVLDGPLRLVEARIDDVVFVSGTVTLEGMPSGSGVLIATGPVKVKAAAAGDGEATGAASDAGAPGGVSLTVRSYADVNLEPGAVLRAAVRARGRVMLGERAVLVGSAVADREVSLASGALVKQVESDATAPLLTVLGPPERLVTAGAEVELAVLYRDDDPGIDVASFALSYDGIDVSDRCEADEVAASCALALGGAGRHLATARVRDLDGNEAVAGLELEVVVDLEPPLVVIDTPADGALLAASEVEVSGTVSDDGDVALVTVGSEVVASEPGTGDGVVRFAARVPMLEGPNRLLVTARDGVGREGTAVVVVTSDLTPPRLVLRSPAALALATNLASVVVAGEVEDEHGIAALEVGGIALPVASEFETEVVLGEGLNHLPVAATDSAGNRSELALEVERRSPPTIAIASPGDGERVQGDAVEVRGTVTGEVVAVVVNGLAAELAGGGYALAALPIEDGATLINAIAISSSGLEAAAGVTVVRDREPPRMVIHHPLDGAVVHEPEVAVMGMVTDVVVGTVNAAQVRVTVNGVAAEVANRAFLLEHVPLAPGENEIVVEALDADGNRGRAGVVVVRAPGGRRIAVAAGDGQSAPVGAALPEPLVAVIRDELGMPVAGRAVVFDADGSDGVFAADLRRVAVTTDALGRAETRLTLGRRAGLHSVTATAAGFEGEARFVARASAGPPALVVVDSGDQQAGVAGQALRSPLAVVVTDHGFNRLEGVAVRFEVIEGGGSFEESGTEALDLVSDSDGRVTARLVLGAADGVGSNVAQARLPDGPESAVVTFAATALAAGDPTATTVSGVVLDNSDQPVPGATVSLEGTALSTRSDAAGWFRLDGAPPGTTHLRVSGATVERPGVWPSLEFLLTIVPGRDNGMGRPIYLLPLDTANALAVGPDRGGVLTLHDLPGFALHIAPGSVTFPGGGGEGVVTVSVVHGDKVPMPPNFGQEPRFVVTIQPGGARFDPPAPIELPNVDGLLPGQVTELYSFDHDLARFVGIGPGTVSADGTRVVSDPGVGIVKAGWHGGGDPAWPATCHDCGDCRRPSGGACVADDSVGPRQRAADDCRRESCRDGRVVSEPDFLEPARQVAGNCFAERCGEPMKLLDLGDAPEPRRCCGNAKVNAPMGKLAGIYDAQDECCVADGLLLVGRKAPIASLEVCPDRVRASLERKGYRYDGCSLDQPLVVALGYQTADNPASDDPVTAFSDETRTLPCDAHDECYQSCGTTEGDRLTCDDRFQQDMFDVCNGAEAAGLDQSVVLHCIVAARTYYLGVRSLGERAFTANQREFCDCCGSSG